jgi:tetratricopeptide (TPR) repeat protein
MKIALKAKLTLLVGALVANLALALFLLAPSSELASHSQPKPTPSPTPRRPLPKPVRGSRGFEQYSSRDASVRLIAATATRPIDAATAYYKRGEDHYNAKEYPQAVENFSQAVRLKPDWLEARYALAASLTEVKKLRESIEQFKKVLSLNPKAELRVVCNYNLANAYADLGEYPEAVEGYKQAIKLNPELSKPHNNLGLAYAAMGKLSEAVVEFKLAVQKKEDYDQAHFNLGVAYLQLGNRPEAEEEQRILVRLNLELAGKLDALIKQ